MNLIRIAWAVFALACVSYVGLGFVAAKRAEAGVTATDIQALVTLFGQSRFKIVNMSTIGVWTAISGEVATCHVLKATPSLAVLNQDGWYIQQVMVADLPTNETERGCYDRAKTY